MIDIICHHIQNHLKENNLSATRLEKAAQLKPGTLRNILYQNSTNPTAETLVKLARAMNMSIDALVKGKSSFVIEGELTMAQVERTNLLMSITVFLIGKRKKEALDTGFFDQMQIIYDYCVKYHKGQFDEGFALHTVEKQQSSDT